MSVGGPSALGTLLVQRLDAALGITLSQQANLVSGARPDAVSQADDPSWLSAAQNETLRHPQETVDQVTARTGQQDSVVKSRLDAGQLDAALLDSAAATASTPSAPTTLGFAAKTILALLSLYPDQAPAVMGKAPLVDPSAPGPAAGPASPGAPGASDAHGAPASPVSSALLASSASPISPALFASSASPGALPPAGGNAPATGHAAAPDANPTVQNVPGTAGNEISARTFVQALSQALQGSGLFYESHLNELSFGQRSVASLMTEPQAPLAHAGAAADHGPTQPATASQVAAQAGQLASLHPDTHLLVRQQLEVLANQTLMWSGQAWPNAPMRWEIERRESPPGTPDTSGDHWATRLNLSLPQLGSIEARLSLSGQQLVMRLVAPQASDRLSAQSAELRKRLLDSGVTLSHLSVVAAEPSDSRATPEVAS